MQSVHEILCDYTSVPWKPRSSALLWCCLRYCTVLTLLICVEKICSGISFNMKPPLQYFLHDWSFLFPVYYIMELIGSFDLGHSVNAILFTEAFPCWKFGTNILILRGRKTCKYLTLQFTTVLLCCRVHGISKKKKKLKILP